MPPFLTAHACGQGEKPSFMGQDLYEATLSESLTLFRKDILIHPICI